ncbi:hypothetical protein CPT_Sansa96 [Caulobacter phage Sansa]|uniref:Uncharacterized protein n=1 Tax=Caulobacter phage Sansa TaxID=1675600 RepID=A0A0K1LMZ7_9CAUD|nr:hypothetical protein HOR07_gp096 [Caulobacter phage Sansa]AKU43500.1 hypothetical protein CPT_Sansa96 [Caulobacter phage Sansa]
MAMTIKELVELRAKAQRAQTIAPGVWENDHLKVDSSPDFLSYVLLCDAAPGKTTPRVIGGVENGDLVELQREMHADEDGGYGLDWDENGRQLTEYMAAAQPANIIPLVDEVKALREEVASLRRRNGDLLRANSVSHDRIVGLRQALESIHEGRVVRHHGDGHSWTELEDWPPGEASGIARDALKRLGAPQGFQDRVWDWGSACFPPEVMTDPVERGDRFLEEVLELLQAAGYDFARIPALVRYVAARPAGHITQEAGGVLLTLAVYLKGQMVDMQQAAEAELARVWGAIDKIRIKQATKPSGSALPMHQVDATALLVEAVEGFVAITSDSQGVAGYHKNGDVADWGEFDELNVAHKALDAYRQEWGLDIVSPIDVQPHRITLTDAAKDEVIQEMQDSCAHESVRQYPTGDGVPVETCLDCGKVLDVGRMPFPGDEEI